MTQIRNKVTGETLTGTVVHKNVISNTFTFCIKGDERDHHQFREGSWEILPPPLPTGIGAVVKTSLNVVFVRVRSDEYDPWRAAELGTDSYPSGHILGYPPITILSEGVRP